MNCKQGDYGDIWQIDKPLDWMGSAEYLVPDTFLRPFRGDLSNDELENPIIRETETWTQEVAA